MHACYLWLSARTHASNLPAAQFAFFASQPAHHSIFLPTKWEQKLRILIKNQRVWGNFG
jgi:hypothetical protein